MLLSHSFKDVLLKIVLMKSVAVPAKYKDRPKVIWRLNCDFFQKSFLMNLQNKIKTQQKKNKLDLVMLNEKSTEQVIHWWAGLGQLKSYEEYSRVSNGLHQPNEVAQQLCNEWHTSSYHVSCLNPCHYFTCFDFSIQSKMERNPSIKFSKFLSFWAKHEPTWILWHWKSDENRMRYTILKLYTVLKILQTKFWRFWCS